MVTWVRCMGTFVPTAATALITVRSLPVGIWIRVGISDRVNNMLRVEDIFPHAFSLTHLPPISVKSLSRTSD